jgi:RNA polymerase sigma-70 factor, ECF subfamily
VTAIDPFVIQQAEIGASRLVLRAGFKRQDWDDLRQDLILDYLERLPRFDDTRGDLRGFMFGVVRHRAAQIAVQQRRRAQLGDALLANSNSPCRHHSTDYDLKMDIQATVARLPEHLKVVALMLADWSPSQVARLTGKSRSRIYQLIREIRRAFVDAGLTPEILRQVRGAA